MAASLSRYTITDIYWSGRRALTVELETEYTDRHIQMYAGRKLVGVSNRGQLIVTGQAEPTHCPTPILIVMVETADRLTDFSALLPRRPWNRYRLGWTAAGYPADSKWFAIHASPDAGEPVDYDSVLSRVAYIGDQTYSFELPAIDECGAWTWGVLPRDNAVTDGNPGTAAEQSVDAVVYPPDVFLEDDDQRLAVSINAGVLTVGFQYDWVAP